MTFRFRRSIKIMPGVRVNVGKRGVSASVGVRGAHVTVGKDGTRSTVGVPGTGASWTEYRRHDESLPIAGAPRQRASGGPLIAVIMGIVVVLYLSHLFL